MKAMWLLLVVGLLLAAGCTQFVEQTSSQLGACMEKCSSVCELVKENNVSQGNFTFNSITLTKQSGNMKVYCTCPCG